MCTRKCLCGEEVGCEDDLYKLYVDLKHIMPGTSKIAHMLAQVLVVQTRACSSLGSDFKFWQQGRRTSIRPNFFFP